MASNMQFLCVSTSECASKGGAVTILRGGVKIVLQDVLRVRMVYVAIYLNIDNASG